MTTQKLGCDTCRCAAKDCPEKESCLRWVDKGEYCYRMSMSDFFTDPVKDADGKCGWRIPVEPDQPTE